MIHHDREGKPTTLDKLCRDEPEWATNAIRQLRAERDAIRDVAGRIMLACNELPDCPLCSYEDGNHDHGWD